MGNGLRETCMIPRGSGKVSPLKFLCRSVCIYNHNIFQRGSKGAHNVSTLAGVGFTSGT